MSYYIDIHTHQGLLEDDEVFALKSLRVEELSTSNLTKCQDHTLGLHPYFRGDLREDSWLLFRNSFLDYQDCFWGIGECGLDKRSEVALEVQIDFFERQITFAEELRKPVVLHIVKAWGELLSVKRRFQSQQAWIVHGFRGKPELARQLLDAGFYLSFGEHYNLESFLLAESYGRAFLETDEACRIGIKEFYFRSAQKLGLELEELKERYYQRFLSLS